MYLHHWITAHNRFSAETKIFTIWNHTAYLPRLILSYSLPSNINCEVLIHALSSRYRNARNVHLEQVSYSVLAHCRFSQTYKWYSCITVIMHSTANEEYICMSDKTFLSRWTESTFWHKRWRFPPLEVLKSNVSYMALVLSQHVTHPCWGLDTFPQYLVVTACRKATEDEV